MKNSKKKEITLELVNDILIRYELNKIWWWI